MKLLIQAVAASLFGLVFFGVFLFGPAGTFTYWQAWVFIAIFTAMSSGPTMYWGLRKPDVLRRRMHAGPIATPVVVVGNILVAVGLGVAMMVVNQNDYAAATITVEADQPVISTGLYGLVRHPMYAGALIMMVGMPLALDSYWGLLTVLPGLAVLAFRIVDEEKMLRQELAGYDEYAHTVHYRLVPGVW